MARGYPTPPRAHRTTPACASFLNNTLIEGRPGASKEFPKKLEELSLLDPVKDSGLSVLPELTALKLSLAHRCTDEGRSIVGLTMLERLDLTRQTSMTKVSSNSKADRLDRSDPRLFRPLH
jgi:hypothetical protein